MSDNDRVLEHLDSLVAGLRRLAARSPVKVIRASRLRARERNAFDIGRTFGAHIGEPLPPEPTRRRHLFSVPAPSDEVSA